MLPKLFLKHSISKLKQAIEIISASKNIVILTGAGISVASGIPTFRGEGGFYRGFDATEVLTRNYLIHQPQIIWEFFRDF